MGEREMFIQHACAMGMHATGNEQERRDHVERLHKTAEALADRLGFPPAPEPLEPVMIDLRPSAAGGAEDLVRQSRAALAEIARHLRLPAGDWTLVADGVRGLVEHTRALETAGVTRARVDELEQLGAANAKRIAELEKELEQATAPKPRTK